MLGGIAIIILSGLISFAIIDRMKVKYPFIDAALLKNLFYYHILLSLAYYGYVMFNPSDSKGYYMNIIQDFRGDTWFSLYGTSTIFIEFVAYPFIKFLGFSYEAMMALFSFFGYLGFLYFYIFFRENIRFKHYFLGKDLLSVIFFLPNLHFWSASLGKGAFIFLGIGLFFFGISNVKRRIVAIIIGGMIIYHVRPHIMLVMLVSCTIGFVFSSKGISMAWRIVFLTGAVMAFFFIFKDVLSLVGMDEENFSSEGLNLTHRAKELSKATSGVDITNYSLPMQVFTFLYRPLFVDAPGALGLIVSFENVFYLAITLKMLTSFKGLRHLITGSFLSKSAFFSFITVSIALAQISGNLGLAMRQKSQVMILFMFVIISFMDEEKMKEWKIKQEHKKRLARMQATKMQSG
jgi:hypothetical protein